MGIIILNATKANEKPAVLRRVGYAMEHANSAYRYTHAKRRHLLNCREEMLRALKEIDTELGNG